MAWAGKTGRTSTSADPHPAQTIVAASWPMPMSPRRARKNLGSICVFAWHSTHHTSNDPSRLITSVNSMTTPRVPTRGIIHRLLTMSLGGAADFLSAQKRGRVMGRTPASSACNGAFRGGSAPVRHVWRRLSCTALQQPDGCHAALATDSQRPPKRLAVVIASSAFPHPAASCPFAPREGSISYWTSAMGQIAC
jgi:hypothetical protein